MPSHQFACAGSGHIRAGTSRCTNIGKLFNYFDYTIFFNVSRSGLWPAVLGSKEISRPTEAITEQKFLNWNCPVGTVAADPNAPCSCRTSGGYNDTAQSIIRETTMGSDGEKHGHHDDDTDHDKDDGQPPPATPWLASNRRRIPVNPTPAALGLGMPIRPRQSNRFRVTRHENILNVFLYGGNFSTVFQAIQPNAG